MNRNTFILSMVVESFFALAAMGLIFSDVGAIIYLYAIVVFGLVLSPFILRLKKAQDEAKKRKIRRNMALLLLIPIAAGVIAYVAVVVILIIGFAS